MPEHHYHQLLNCLSSQTTLRIQQYDVTFLSVKYVLSFSCSGFKKRTFSSGKHEYEINASKNESSVSGRNSIQHQTVHWDNKYSGCWIIWVSDTMCEKNGFCSTSWKSHSTSHGNVFKRGDLFLKRRRAYPESVNISLCAWFQAENGYLSDLNILISNYLIVSTMPTSFNTNYDNIIQIQEPFQWIHKLLKIQPYFGRSVTTEFLYTHD